MSKQNTPKKEQGSVPNEQPTPAYQLTKLELKRRLKHIAGLCYSLVCDLSNVEIEAEHLRAENEYLRRKLNGQKTSEQRERRLAYMREYMRKRNAEKKAHNAAQSGEDGKPKQDASRGRSPAPLPRSGQPISPLRRTAQGTRSAAARRSPHGVSHIPPSDPREA